MADPTNPDLTARLARLEVEVRELRARVIALERLVGASAEHPADSATVQRKVAYDWQA